MTTDYDPDTRPTITCPNPKCGHSIIIPPLLGEMGDRHPKWKRVEPGTVIPAGQPYRVESTTRPGVADEGIMELGEVPYVLNETQTRTSDWFVDSSWVPPLVLPTARSLILAEVDDRYTEDKVLLTGPHTDKGNTWWSFDTRLSVIPDEINSFEVLWTEGETRPRFPSQEDAFR